MRPIQEIIPEFLKAKQEKDAPRLRAIAEELGVANDLESGALRETAEGLACQFDQSFSEALEHFEEALTMCVNAGHTVESADMDVNIGAVYETTGDFPQALKHYTQALEKYEQADSKPNIARMLGAIGSVYAWISDNDRALQLAKDELAIQTEIGNEQGIADAHARIGRAYSLSSDHASTIEHQQEALKRFEALGDREGYAKSINNVAFARVQLGDLNGALEAIESIDVDKIENPSTRSLFPLLRGRISRERGDLSAAREHMQEALSIAEAFGVRARQLNVHQQLRNLAEEMRDFDAYVHHNKEFQRLSDEIVGRDSSQKIAILDTERKIEAERRERDKERAVLYSTLPKDIADRVVRGDDVSGDEYDDVSILFLDIAGFTSHSHDLAPRVVTELLERIFHRFDEICAAHEVTKIKTIGDAYMAVAFPTEEHADGGTQHRAARAALDMIAESFTWPDGSTIVFRIGLHRGPVVAGVIGKQRLQYDVWGDTVNVASRMESTSEPGRIQVSEPFAAALQDSSFSLAERGHVDVKGKGVMNTFWLERSA